MRLSPVSLVLLVTVGGWYSLMLAMPRGPREEDAIRLVRTNFLALQKTAAQARAEGRTLTGDELLAWSGGCDWPAGGAYAGAPAVCAMLPHASWVVRLTPPRDTLRPPLWEQALFLDFRGVSLPTLVMASHDLRLCEMYPELTPQGDMRIVTYAPDPEGGAPDWVAQADAGRTLAER